MLCDKCKTKEATFHYKVSENGNVTEVHLCGDCAKEAGISTESIFGSHTGNIFADFLSDDDVFGSFFGGLLGKNAPSLGGSLLGNSAVCPSCGMTENELSRGGKLGCAECYKTFSRLLAPTVAKLHGNVVHTGKSPKGYAAHKEKVSELDELKKKLSTAIEAQEYEEAAKLRDKIRDLEKKDGDTQ